ncbi:hypothetical protein PENSPDRAFT_694065 [Peniophora sp. CONT]|nr:hypothetical protein PENSPDRAFT_694065 [Peniophora sp. CONT]
MTNYTITVTTIFSARQTYLHDLARPLPTFSSLVDAWIIGVALLGFTTWRTWLYFTREGSARENRSTSRIVACLWMLDVLRFVLLCDQLYHVRIYSGEQLPMSREGISKASRLLRLSIGPIISVHFYISFITWKEIYAANGNSKIQATLWTLATWLPGVEKRIATTHSLVFARLGVVGTARALIAPENVPGSGCPRLRMSSGLGNMITTRHDSRRRLLIGSVLMFVLNVLALTWICNINDKLQTSLLPGHPGLKPSIPLSCLYTALYLAIKSSQAADPGPTLPPAVAEEHPKTTTPAAPTTSLHGHTVTAYLPLALALGTAALRG